MILNQEFGKILQSLMITIGKKYYVEKGFWEECLYNTLRKFKNRYAFVPHIWSPMNKYKFMDLCEKYDYTKDIGCIVFSFYYNFINQPYKKKL